MSSFVLRRELDMPTFTILNRQCFQGKQHNIRVSRSAPDVANAFSMLTKEDTSHGFQAWRPLERNSDLTLYNPNSEGWFQAWSVISGIVMVSLWYWIADHHFFINSSGYEDEDQLRIKDAKAT